MQKAMASLTWEQGEAERLQHANGTSETELSLLHQDLANAEARAAHAAYAASPGTGADKDMLAQVCSAAPSGHYTHRHTTL